MSGSEDSSTKQSTSRVSQGCLYGALEQGNAWLAVTTANARISIKTRTGESIFFPSFLYDGQGRLLSCRIQHCIENFAPIHFQV